MKLLLILFSILLIISSCNKDDEELPLILSDNCKMERMEVFNGQVLDQIKEIDMMLI